MLITNIPGISMGLVSALSNEKTKVASNISTALDADADEFGKNIQPLDPSEIPGEYHWRAAMTVADSSINYQMVAEFAHLLKQKKSGGKITVDLYPGGQLGNTTEFTEAVVMAPLKSAPE